MEASGGWIGSRLLIGAIGCFMFMGALNVCCTIRARWCSGFYLGFLRRRSGVRFPYPPVLEKCAKGFAYAIFFG